jgi:hypothetical protein
MQMEAAGFCEALVTYQITEDLITEENIISCATPGTT